MFDNWEPGEIIAGIALVISITGSIFNFFYSRRLFRQQNYPDIRIQYGLEFQELKGISTKITLKVQNVSADRPINNVFLKTELGIKEKRQKIKWNTYSDGYLELLEAGNSVGIGNFRKINQSKQFGLIEDCIINYAPNLLRNHKLEESSYSSRRLISPTAKFYFRFDLKYGRGVYGLKPTRRKVTFILKPIYEFEDEITVLKHWKMEWIYYARYRRKYIP